MVLFCSRKKILRFIGVDILYLNFCLQILYIFMWCVGNVQILMWVAVVFNVLMYAGPLENLKQVCKTGNYNLLPIVTIIITIVNTFCWMVYGIGTGYLQTWLPNTLGLLLGFIEIGLWIYYRKKCGGHWVDPNTPKEGEQVE